jgi:dihydroneopterin aldolase
MRFHVRVGVLPHERELAQPLEVDLTVFRSGALGGARSAGGVLDYRDLYAATAAVADAGQPHEYLEEIADAVAERALALGGVRRARVAVRKPHVMLAGPLAHAEVVLERDADGDA